MALVLILIDASGTVYVLAQSEPDLGIELQVWPNLAQCYRAATLLLSLGLKKYPQSLRNLVKSPRW
jgi:hypothetical protein